MQKVWQVIATLMPALVVCGCSGESDSADSPSIVKGDMTVKATLPDQVAEDGGDHAPVDTYSFIAPALTEAELRAGWVSLFDGVSLFGWDIPAGTNWHVEDGSIVASEGEISQLQTPFVFDDFEMRCDFHLEEGGNSGVFLRNADPVSDPAVDTYELNICDSHESYGTGSLVGRHVAENVPPSEGEWHTFRIHCEGPRLQVWLDDTQIVDFTDEGEHVRLSGRVGLQKNKGRIAFRNVFLRPLNDKELFNGEDLSGFRSVPGSKSEFEVRDGAIHVANGPGFLETEETFGDFMLHVEARTNGTALNSGVFFRAKQGTAAAPSHGYEMQIHNGFEGDDRTRPLDSGTGAIFRRAAARYVVADDNTWLVATLLAQGNRFATWVNGYPVVSWVDDRQPSDNPREGLRLDAGHLSLQGHDPKTDLDFRSIRVHEFQNP